jgi:hypothetical protein
MTHAASGLASRVGQPNFGMPDSPPVANRTNQTIANLASGSIPDGIPALREATTALPKIVQFPYESRPILSPVPSSKIQRVALTTLDQAGGIRPPSINHGGLQLLPVPIHSWIFEDKELSLVPKNDRFDLWLINRADGTRKLQNPILEFLAAQGAVTAQHYIRCLNKARLKMQPNGDVNVQISLPIHIWTWGNKQIELIPNEDKFSYRASNINVKKTEQVELPIVDQPLRYYPVEQAHGIVPTPLKIFHRWNSNGWKIELVQTGKEVFYLATRGAVSQRFDPIPFEADWTPQIRISRCLEYDAEARADGTLVLTKLDCLYTWKGDNEYTIMRRGDDLSIRIVKKQGNTITLSRIRYPIHEQEADISRLVSHILYHELIIDENRTPVLQAPEVVHEWQVNETQKGVIIRRQFIKNGLAEEELDYLLIDRNILAASRTTLSLEPGITVQQQIEKLPVLEPVINQNLTLRGLYKICKVFPILNRKQICLQVKEIDTSKNDQELIWRVEDIDTHVLIYIPVDFARDFPEEAQISFLKNQMASEDIPARHTYENIADVQEREKLRRKATFNYQLINSKIKQNLLIKESISIEHINLAWCGYSFKSWPQSQEMLTIFSASHLLRLIKSPIDGLRWAIYDYLQSTVKYVAFNFNEIMQNMPPKTRRWFAKCFKVSAFDHINNIITTKMEVFQSKLDPSKLIDNDVWAITHVNTDEGMGHSEIAIEGVEKGVPFLTYAGIGDAGSASGTASTKPRVHITRGSVMKEPGMDGENIDWRLWRPKFEQKGPTWLRERSTIQKTIESIYHDLSEQAQGNPVPFDLLGGPSLMDIILVVATLGLYTFPLLSKIEKRPVNCIEWLQRKVSHAGIHPLPKFKFLYTDPKDFLDPNTWEQSRSLNVRTMTQPDIRNASIDTCKALIFLPLKYKGKTIFISCDLTQPIQDALGDCDWSSIGLVGHLNEWDYPRRYSPYAREFEQVIFSVMIRGRSEPTNIDVTNYLRQKYPDLEIQRIGQERRDNEHTPGRGESWGWGR